MTKAKLPPGIYVRQWKNKRTRQVEVRYQVKISRKDLKFSRFFETEKEARDYLADMLSPKARKAITEAEKESAREALKKAMKAQLFKHAEKTFSQCLEAYLKHLEPTPEAFADMTKTRQSTITARRARVSAIKSIEIDFIEPDKRQQAAAFPKHAESLSKRQRIADFKLHEIDGFAAREFVKERCKKVSAETVKRDLGFIGGMFNALPDFDSYTAERITANPFKELSLKRLKTDAQPSTKPTAKRLTEEQETTLIETLKNAKTRGFKERSTMLHITVLALETGMRRGEILELEWSRILPDRIVLRETDTKTGAARWVPMTDTAAAILADVERKEGRDKVFTYTPSGFAANWDRARKKAGVPTLGFHQLRHEFITRTLNALSAEIPAVVAARKVGAVDVDFFEKTHLEKARRERAIKDGIKTQKDVMAAVGHTAQSTTAIYFADES